MSDKEKVVTKYDRKMQRRQAEKEKLAREKKISNAVGAVAAVAVVGLIASFPIRSYIATHETFVTVNGENITRAEFDYNYNNTVSNYLNQYGSFIQYMGLDVNKDFAEQEYAEGLTWKDNFEEMTIDNMKTNKALKAEAVAAGFTYDSSKEVQKFKDNVSESAKAASISNSKFIKQTYGKYASVNSVASFVAEDAMITAYMQEVSEGLKASDEEIKTYYSENASDYDSVDFYVQEFPAAIPEDASEEDIQRAMDAASNEADAQAEQVAKTGELQTNVKYSDANSAYASWLFEEGRNPGDVTVAIDEANNCYYSIGFVNRYLDDATTANIRVIFTDESKGQSILDEFKAGDGSEASFIALWDKYSTDTSTKQGLYENISKDGLTTDMADWVFAEDRQAGDAVCLTTESGSTFVMYYASQGDLAWKASISSTLMSQATNEYIENAAADVTVEDPKGHLNYLKVQAAADAEDVSDGDAASVSEGDANGNETEIIDAQ